MPVLRPILRIWAGLSGDTAYSLISALGLAVGFAVFFLLAGLVRNVFSFDSQVPDVAHVYLLKAHPHYAANNDWKETVAMPYREVVSHSKLVAAYSAQIPYPATLRGPDGRLRRIDLSLIDPGFIGIFGVTTLRGDMARALASPYTLSLGAALAQEIFGRTDVVGETVRIAGKPYTVCAVHADPPSNTVMPYVALAGLNSAVFPDVERRAVMNEWSQRSIRLFVRSAPDTDPAQLDALVQQALADSPLARSSIAFGNTGRVYDFHFVTLQDAYFDEEAGRTGDNGKRGSRRNAIALGCVACLVLLMAAASHAGLAASRALARQREIGVRKTLGAGSIDIALLFLAESAALSLAAIAAGLLLAWLLAPLFAEMVDMKLDGLFDLSFVAAASVTALFLGTAAGLYPAWLAASIRAGRAQPEREAGPPRAGGGLRQILTAAEFAATSACTVLAIAVAWQSTYAVHLDPGFDPAPLLTLKLPVYIQTPEAQSFCATLRRIPGVSGVTSNLQAIGLDHWSHSVEMVAKGHDVTIELKQVTPEFFKVYGVKPLAGRLFDPADGPENHDIAVLNAEAIRILGFASPEEAVGKVIGYRVNDTTRTTHVIGVAPPIRYENLREKPRAIGYGLLGYTANLTIRVEGGELAKASVRKAIVALWPTIFPDDALLVRDAADLYRQDYQDDLNQAQLMCAAVAIAVIITGFGMYVLAVRNVRGRAKEIVLRKLHGASGWNIALFVARHTVWPVVAGTLVGIGIGAAAMHIYLNDFIERAPMGWWPLLTAFVLACAIAVFASLRHTLMAMRLAPSLALKF